MTQMSFRAAKVLGLVLVAVSLVFAAGCNQGQTTQKFAGQIKPGMTSAQVAQIMGNPTQVKQEGLYTEWKYYTSNGKFEVKFQNDQVAFVESH